MASHGRCPSFCWIAGLISILPESIFISEGFRLTGRRHFDGKVKLNGAPFKAFAAQRDTWAKETAYVYPGPIQYFGPTEVCDQPTKTLQLEQAK